MSVEEEVAVLLAEAKGVEARKAELTVDSALKAVGELLSTTGETFIALCQSVEGATGKDELKAACRRFNAIMRFFIDAAPEPQHLPLVRAALSQLGMYGRLASFMETATSFPEAIKAYKLAILQEVAAAVRRREEQARQDDLQDDELFSRFLPEPVSPVSSGTERQSAIPLVNPRPLKRDVSMVEALDPIPKKAKRPTLVSLDEVSGNLFGETPKKKLLMTRERLRAGFHNPKGLLNLVDSSTNALERTKQLELLKSAGFEFNNKNKHSFVDKLNAAKLRLDLGIAAHSLSDTYLFGADVLSIPGFLSSKNISDIQNNVVDGKTTWKHQNAYCKTVIAGCLNQAKRILEKYDEILYGPAPESLIGEVHSTIRNLLKSEEARMFSAAGTDSTMSDEDQVGFIKKFVEAVSPIVPITLRNKTLDGSFFRTAVSLLGAAEFLLAQYEQDVRTQANPAGVIGMCSSMHAEFERCAIYNENLRPLQEFIKDMRAQYNTSLGLGASFQSDGRRRQRKLRGRRFGYGGVFRSQGQEFPQSAAVPPVRGGDVSTGLGRGQSQFGQRRAFHDGGGRGQDPFTYMRGRGLCYNFQTGNCNRGNACRFTHSRF